MNYHSRRRHPGPQGPGSHPKNKNQPEGRFFGYGWAIFQSQISVLATEDIKWIFWICFLGFERTQQPRDLSCCRLRHADAKSRPHHRAKYSRGGFGINRVMT